MTVTGVRLTKQIERMVGQTVCVALATKSRRATKFLSPELTIKATLQRRPDGREKAVTVLVTIGKPNFSERAFIASCFAAGEQFPVKRPQLKGWPKARAK